MDLSSRKFKINRGKIKKDNKMHVHNLSLIKSNKTRKNSNNNSYNKASRNSPTLKTINNLRL